MLIYFRFYEDIKSMLGFYPNIYFKVSINSSIYIIIIIIPFTQTLKRLGHSPNERGWGEGGSPPPLLSLLVVKCDFLFFSGSKYFVIRWTFCKKNPSNFTCLNAWTRVLPKIGLFLADFFWLYFQIIFLYLLAINFFHFSFEVFIWTQSPYFW